MSPFPRLALFCAAIALSHLRVSAAPLSGVVAQPPKCSCGASRCQCGPTCGCGCVQTGKCECGPVYNHDASIPVQFRHLPDIKTCNAAFEEFDWELHRLNEILRLVGGWRGDVDGCDEFGDGPPNAGGWYAARVYAEWKEAKRRQRLIYLVTWCTYVNSSPGYDWQRHLYGELPLRALIGDERYWKADLFGDGIGLRPVR